LDFIHKVWDHQRFDFRFFSTFSVLELCPCLLYFEVGASASYGHIISFFSYICKLLFFRLKKIQEKKKKIKKVKEDKIKELKEAGLARELEEGPNILSEGHDEDLLFTD